MKRWWLCLAALALLFGAGAQAETYAVSVDLDSGASYGLLVDDGGQVLTERYEYARIYALSDDVPGVFVAQAFDQSPYLEQNGGVWSDEPRVCLLDETGAQLTGFDYTELSYDAAGGAIVAVRWDGGCDVLDARGEVLARTDYAWLSLSGSGGALALRADPEREPAGDSEFPTGDEGELVYVDADGAETALGIRTARWQIGPYRDGLCMVYGGDGYHYFDANGEEPFRVSFRSATDFAFGTAIVSTDEGRYGVIDAQGRYVLPPVYDTISRSDQYDAPALVAVTASGALEIRSADGGTLKRTYDPGDFLPDADSPATGVDYAYQINAGMIVASGDGGTAYLDLEGNLLFWAQEGETVSAWYEIEDGTLPQRVAISTGDWPESECWLADLSGERIGGSYRQIYCTAWLDGEGRYMTQDYDVVAEEYDGASSLTAQNVRFGICDAGGNVLLDAAYDSITCLSANRFWVRQGPVCGLLDETGAWLLTISDYEELMD